MHFLIVNRYEIKTISEIRKGVHDRVRDTTVQNPSKDFTFSKDFRDSQRLNEMVTRSFTVLNRSFNSPDTTSSPRPEPLVAPAHIHNKKIVSIHWYDWRSARKAKIIKKELNLREASLKIFQKGFLKKTGN